VISLQGQASQKNDGFKLTIAEDCPEKVISFALAISSDEGTWIRQLDLSIATAVSSITLENSLLLYPNPTLGSIYLDSKGSTQEPIKLQITDMNGRVMLVRELEHFRATDVVKIDVSAFTNGLYILRIDYSEISIHRKFIKL